MKDIGDGPEATGSHTTRPGVTTVHSPKHEVALVWIQLQQQHHSLTTQLVNLEETTQQLLEPCIHFFQQLLDNPLISQYLILVHIIKISTGTNMCCKAVYYKTQACHNNMDNAMRKLPHDVSYILFKELLKTRE